MSGNDYPSRIRGLLTWRLYSRESVTRRTSWISSRTSSSLTTHSVPPSRSSGEITSSSESTRPSKRLRTEGSGKENLESSGIPRGQGRVTQWSFSPKRYTGNLAGTLPSSSAPTGTTLTGRSTRPLQVADLSIMTRIPAVHQTENTWPSSSPNTSPTSSR
ncbi:MAG: hypothetical protein BWY45_02924 [Euryarchaeota archaeon ADurb.Bin294]|nr:MAG: hypothetical protein BWY45_02924 [Euryarchaeota archaeon ADurb.Bin294]